MASDDLTELLGKKTKLTIEALECIKKLERKNGDLLVDDVLNEAESEDSPLHAHFTWDDSEAALRYRKLQARSLIRRVKVRVTINQHEQRTPVYLPTTESHTYRNAEKLTKKAARETLDRELRRANGHLGRAVGVCGRFDADVASELDKMRERIDEIVGQATQA